MKRQESESARRIRLTRVWKILLGLLFIVLFFWMVDSLQRHFYYKPFRLDQEYEVLRQIKAHPRFCNSLFQQRGRPIVEAADRGWPDAVRELLAQGADPNARDGLGYLAILVASDDSRPEGEQIVGMLLDAGADPHLSDQVHSDLMCSACGSLNTGVITLLIERGWDPNRPKQGIPEANTPLHYAFHSPNAGIEGTERLETLKLLVKYGANVHQKIRGKSILEWIEEDEKSTIPSVQEAIVELQPEIRYLREVGLNQPQN